MAKCDVRRRRSLTDHYRTARSCNWAAVGTVHRLFPRLCIAQTRLGWSAENAVRSLPERLLSEKMRNFGAKKGGIAMSTDAILNALFLGLITVVLVLIAVWAFNAIYRKR